MKIQELIYKICKKFMIFVYMVIGDPLYEIKKNEKSN